MADEVADLAIRLSGDVGPFVTAMHRAERAGTDAAQAAQRVQRSQGAMAAQSGRSSSSMRASSGIMRSGALAVAGAFATAAIAGVGAVRSAATYETTLRQVAVATNAPASALKELDALAMKMGQDTVFSAQEAGDAMLELAKSGMTPAQIKGGALASTLTLASAGSLELAESAGYVTSGLALFNLRADQSADVAAALAGAANASKASVQDMGLALSQVGPGAAQAGLSLQETTAVLAAFAANGILGSDAGTSLKTMLARLIPSTDAAEGAMEDLGLAFTDAHGNIKPIANIAEQLRVKLSGLSDAQRIAALNTIFGSDASRAAAILMKEGAAGVEAFTKATSDKTQAERLAKAATEGTAGAMEQLSGSWDTAKLKIGQALAPALVVLANLLTDVANRIPGVVTWFQEHKTATIALAAVIGVLLVGAVGALTASFISMSIAFLASPVGLVTLGIAALAAIFVVAWRRSEKFRDVMKTVFYAVQVHVLTMADVAITAFKLMLTVWTAVVGDIINRAAAAFGWVPGVGDKLKAAAAGFNSFRDDALNALDTAQAGIRSRLDTAERELAIHAALAAVSLTTPLRDRLPQYQALAQRFSMTLPELLKKSSVPTGDQARLLAWHAAMSLEEGTPAMRAISARLAQIPAAALKDSDTRTAAIARATGLGIGDAMADGLVVGMRNGIRQVSQVARTLGEVAGNAARHGAEVFSPSRHTRYTGQMVARGLQLGIEDGQSLVERAAGALGRAATDVPAARQSFALPAVARSSLADFRAGTGPASGRPIHVTVELDGRVLARAVADENARNSRSGRS